MKLIKINRKDVIKLLVAGALTLIIILAFNFVKKNMVEGFANGDNNNSGPSDVLEANENLAGLVQRGYVVPPYIVVAYAGTTSSIPDGWALCDGGNYSGVTTPDLSDKFIYGSGTHPVPTASRTGGSATVTITGANAPAHTHTITIAHGGDHGHTHSCASDDGGKNADSHYAMGDADAYKPCQLSGGSHSHTATASVVGSANPTPLNILPPYYKLAYIMKLPN